MVDPNLAFLAGGGRMAAQIAAHGEARPDMLVTDIGLPNGMNGRQLADQVRVRWPRLPVLLVTGYAESTVMKNDTLPARMELLTKPFAMHSLVDRVDSMLAAAAADAAADTDTDTDAAAGTAADAVDAGAPAVDGARTAPQVPA